MYVPNLAGTLTSLERNVRSGARLTIEGRTLRVPSMPDDSAPARHGAHPLRHSRLLDLASCGRCTATLGPYGKGSVPADMVAVSGSPDVSANLSVHPARRVQQEGFSVTLQDARAMITNGGDRVDTRRLTKRREDASKTTPTCSARLAMEVFPATANSSSTWRPLRGRSRSQPSHWPVARNGAS